MADKKDMDKAEKAEGARETLKMKKGAGFDVDGLPSEAELDALQAEIDKAHDDMAKREAVEEVTPEQRIEQLETELANLKDQALRAMADADNVKKRAAREVAAAKTFGIERFAVDVLSVSDNLSRALLTMDGTAVEDLGDNAKNLLSGLELTEKELMAVLARHGIKAVPGVGSKFDPNVHQAVAQVPSDEDKGNVATVMQTGFKLGERTLRAAMVAVSTGPAK
ncbi:nucleotide exchange factor GrpE [Fretibacter rubidus]|uniref:nucleotide exchange factor GrpE n=1 Tax=Fretibacter rubidus TaxID=570162 RepID=UPI00352AB2FB